MSLYKRLHDVQGVPANGAPRRDPVLDELRQRIHHHLIDELGPILYDKRLSEDDLRRRVNEQLHAALCKPVPFEGRLLALGASIGAAWHDGRVPADLGALLRRADEAMYAAKQAGGGIVIADRLAAVARTVNGRRAGRPGTHLSDQGGDS